MNPKTMGKRGNKKDIKTININVLYTEVFDYDLKS